MVRKFEYDDGTIFYTNDNGDIHREDGPAVILSNGRKEWYINGKSHNDNGPAVIWSEGEVYWYLDGKEYLFKEWIKLVNISDELKMELALKYG